MTIRFLRFTPVGNVHYNAGESYDFPSEIAKELVKNGDAVPIRAAEYATLHRYGFHAVVPAPARRGR